MPEPQEKDEVVEDEKNPKSQDPSPKRRLESENLANLVPEESRGVEGGVYAPIVALRPDGDRPRILTGARKLKRHPGAE